MAWCEASAKQVRRGGEAERRRRRAWTVVRIAPKIANQGVFSKSVTEPVKYRGELREGEKRECEFVVSSTDAPVSFNAAQEVFDFMAVPIVAPVESDLSATRGFGRNTDAGALVTERGAKGVCVEALSATARCPRRCRNCGSTA